MPGYSKLLEAIVSSSNFCWHCSSKFRRCCCANCAKEAVCKDCSRVRQCNGSDSAEIRPNCLSTSWSWVLTSLLSTAGTSGDNPSGAPLLGPWRQIFAASSCCMYVPVNSAVGPLAASKGTSAVPACRAVSSDSSDSSFGLSNICTWTCTPATTCSTPSAKTLCTASGESMTTSPKLPGRVLGCEPFCWNGFTLECATRTCMTFPYFEKCCSNGRRERKPSLLMRRVMKMQRSSTFFKSSRCRRSVSR
mmetsp:Transcript_32053/g.73204  ORF Transcript_32053/g.73204 Transcript_32053/m.73204 type:complete len:248 (+) Transcript_32053:930-1673(+)